MGLETALAVGVVASSTVSAISSYKSGKAGAASARRVGEFNARIYEQQASVIQKKKVIEANQYNRKAAQLRGQGVAHAASSGFQLSGSPLAMLIDNETNIQYDKAIGQYNLDVERNFLRSQAFNARFSGAEQAKLSMATGKANMYSSIMKGAVSLASIYAGGAGGGTKLGAPNMNTTAGIAGGYRRGSFMTTAGKAGGYYGS